MRESTVCYSVLFTLLAVSSSTHASPPTFKYVTSYVPNGKYIQISEIQKNTVNVLQPLIFIINENDNPNASQDLVAQYLDRQINNVFVVDWNQADATSTRTACSDVGDFITTVFNKTGEQYLNVHLVGVLTGAGVAAGAAQRVRESSLKINRITALDPTYYSINWDAALLRGGNANFVDVVRTKFDKENETLGDVDFYVYDEECIKDETKCDKSTATKLFAQSINSDKIKAIKCDSLIDFQSGTCSKSGKITFGENVPRDIKGKYFLKKLNKF